MIKLYAARYMGCAAALAAGCLLFRIEFSADILAWAALLAALYAVIKPLYSLLALPFDIFLSGIGTLCLDALMIRIFIPYGFAFLQALAVASLVALCFVPYEYLRQLSGRQLR